MRFVADLHIHSHFSVATSGQLRPENLDVWGRAKGVRLIGTGDFTHPGWLAELREKLEPAEPGLFRLKKELRAPHDLLIGETADNSVRFLLTAEISSIYKKDGRVRKVHNLALAPSFEVVEKIQGELMRLGFNITSDGRPILGFDSRDLFELLLGVSERVFLVPAHIWTPWFSALGEKSGFDSIEECYDDLAPLIFAVETGLSSDPPMNWRCGILDRFTLISNSDAHSPDRIGREATLLDADLSYEGVIEALRGGSVSNRCAGTVEFFPQEGKYHADGHRKCGVCWDPAQTQANRGFCSVCGKPVTVGVLNRVAQLADRPEGFCPGGRPRFYSVIPFVEVLSEIVGAGRATKKVQDAYRAILRKLGSEFRILLEAEPEELRRAGGELLAEAIRRMRAGRVCLQPGYDGEYGVIRVFEESELKSIGGQTAMFDLSRPAADEAVRGAPESVPAVGAFPPLSPLSDGAADGAAAVCEAPVTFQAAGRFQLNESQNRAFEHGQGPALVLAGPGTGKTRVLTERIRRLISAQAADAGSLLAVTFTNKAAEEIKSRLRDALAKSGVAPRIGTFHGFGYSVLSERPDLIGRTAGFLVVDDEDRDALLQKELCGFRQSANELGARISAFKQTGDAGTGEVEEFQRALALYDRRLSELNLLDLDDLIYRTVELLRDRPEVLQALRSRFSWILVDEYQDVNFAQYSLIRLLAPAPDSNLFVIGDPDQAIYGFRGADVRFIHRFLEDYPRAQVYSLTHSYRCSGTILKAAESILEQSGKSPLQGLNAGIRISIVKQETDRAEAEFIARTIESMLGGASFFSIDSEVATGSAVASLGFSDFAVLCRIGRQIPLFEEALQNHGIPFQKVDEAPFFKRPPLDVVVEALRLSIAPDNEFPRRKLAARGFDAERVLSEVNEAAGRTSSPEALVTAVASVLLGDQLSLAETERAVRRLAELASGAGATVRDLVRRLALSRGVDGFRPDIENVALMTLHAAKGLEFSCVFIPGCEDGLLPCSAGARRHIDVEEERRLLYVGMTRARRYLFLSHAGRRLLYGETCCLPRSPFLDSIEKDLVDASIAQFRRRQNKPDPQLKLF